MDMLEFLARSLKQGWESELKLVVDAAFPRERLLRIVEELQRTCPDTQIQLSDVVLSGAEQAIVEGGADLVVTSRVPPGHLSDWLLDVTFVAVVRDSGTAQPRDEGWLGAERRFTVSSMEASLATVSAGLAYAWLPEHMLTELLQRGTLKPLPLVAGGARSVSLYAVMLHPEVLGPAARAASAAFHRDSNPSGRTAPT
jgi:DNA-binding transcriptional LysR family regulator